MLGSLFGAFTETLRGVLCQGPQHGLPFCGWRGPTVQSQPSCIPPLYELIIPSFVSDPYVLPGSSTGSHQWMDDTHATFVSLL